MSDLTTARRYALALSDTAGEEGKTHRIDEDIDLIREGLKSSDELVRFFESPVISRERKTTVIRSLFTDRVDPVTLRFLELLVEKRRERLFPQVVRAYRTLRDEQEGVVSVTARVARAMNEEEERQLGESIERMTGKSVRLETQIDSSIMGGILIRVGDTVYDGSVTNQLAALRDRLTGRATHAN